MLLLSFSIGCATLAKLDSVGIKCFGKSLKICLKRVLTFLMDGEFNQMIFCNLLCFCVDFVLSGSYVSWKCHIHANSDHVQMLSHIIFTV